MHTIRTDYEKMLSTIIKTVRDYLEENKSLKSLVVGISGGIDSALTCAIASKAVNSLSDIRLIGRSIPIETNKQDEISRAGTAGKCFCDHFEPRYMTTAYQNLYKELVSGSGRENENTNEEKIRRGNMKARVRMTYLFDLAHLEKGMVLSTDNFTELLLGFWTLHGDVGNFGMLQYLWKTEVYGLAGYLVDKYKKEGNRDKADALQLCIDAVPTDGLGITDNDFDQIGVTDYEAADLLLIDYLNGDRSKADHPVIQRHISSAFKRRDPQNISREMIFSQ